MAGRKQQDIPTATGAASASGHGPDPQIRRRLLETLAGPERYTLFADDVARAFEVDVESARGALRRISDESAWRPAGFPGSRVLVSPELAANGTVIAYLPLGMSIPVHSHAEREMTFVLDGELLDDAQQRFGAGELLDMQIGTKHAITVVGEHACLAVFRRAPH